MSSIRKNYMYSMIYQVLQFIIPLITTPYVARVLGAEGVGCFSYTRSVAYYFLLFAMLGVNNYGNRSIAQVRDNQKTLNRVFSEIFQTQFIISTVSISTYIIYVIFFCSEYQDIAMFQLIYLLSAAFDINWFFFGLEKFKITVTCKSIIKIASAALIFVFVKSSNDLYLYTIVMSVGYFLGQCYLWIGINKYVKFNPCPIKRMLPHLKPLFLLFLPTIATSIYRVMDKIMIGNIASISDVGLYDNADKIVVVCLGVISAWGNVMLPRASNLYAKNNIAQCMENLKKSIHFIVCISAAMSFGLVAISQDVAILLFGNEFIGSGEILFGLAISILFIGISNTTRTQVLIPLGMDKQYLISVSVGALVNITINYILIKKIGVLGAVIGTISTEFLVALIQVYFVHLHFQIWKMLVGSFPYIIIGFLMFFTVKLFTVSVELNLIITVLASIIIGVVTYALATVIYWKVTKNEFYYLLKRFINR